MNKPATPAAVTAAAAPVKQTGLALLRQPFPAHQISKLPKPTQKQTEEVKANYRAGIRCIKCGAWHHPDVVHLDYVGHAALTDRLLEADPSWSWEPAAIGPDGGPILDKDGGMWIRLTVCGVTRLGYGDAGDKKGGNAMKERIGDALRNAAMRFGAGLELWHKGELHVEPIDEPAAHTQAPAPSAPPPKEQGHLTAEEIERQVKIIQSCSTEQSLVTAFNAAYALAKEAKSMDAVHAFRQARDLQMKTLSQGESNGVSQ